METIAPLSPFWTGDPATDLEETRVLARAVGGADPADPWLIYTTGAGRIPVVTPTALDPERPATIAVWRTPAVPARRHMDAPAGRVRGLLPVPHDPHPGRHGAD